MFADCPRCDETVRFTYEESSGSIACPACDTLFHPLTGEVVGGEPAPPPVRRRAAAPPPPPPVRRALRGAVEVADESPPPTRAGGLREPSRAEWLPFWGCVAATWLVVLFIGWWSVQSQREQTAKSLGGLGGALSGLGGAGNLDGMIKEQVEGAQSKIVYAYCGGVLAYSTFMMLWLARDAKARGVRYWEYLPALLPATGGLFAVLYLIGRPPGHLTACPRCAGQRLAFATRCPHCGAALPGV